MDIFTQQIINGLVLGSVYALVALGYTMLNCWLSGNGLVADVGMYAYPQ